MEITLTVVPCPIYQDKGSLGALAMVKVIPDPNMRTVHMSGGPRLKLMYLRHKWEGILLGEKYHNQRSGQYVFISLKLIC